MKYLVTIFIIINFLVANDLSRKPADVLKLYNIKCQNNELVFPKNYGKKYSEKLEITHLLLLSRHIILDEVCGSMIYSLLPFISIQSLQLQDIFFTKLLLDSNIYVIAGDGELGTRLFPEFQLPVIIGFKYMDDLNLMDRIVDQFARDFCLENIDMLDEIGNGPYYTRQYVLDHMPKSMFLTKFKQKVHSNQECTSLNAPFLPMTEEWKKILHDR